MNYRFNDAATKDLTSIYHFGIERFGVAQADRYLGGLLDFLDKLADAPTTYPKLGSDAPGYRRAVWKRTSILYRDTDGVEIMRILGQQDPRSALKL